MRSIHFMTGLAAAFILASGLPACGSDSGGNNSNPDASTGGNPDAGGTATQAVTINFAAMVGDQPATCSGTYDNIGTAGSTVSISDLRFYVSNLRLLDSQGNETPITLDENDWQHSSVALLDFEDGTGGCAASGTTATNTSVTGTVPTGSYTGLKFDVGLPFAMDHLDVGSAPAPLNVSGLYWTWAAGYKFIRVDLSVGGTLWSMHLGSTMCQSGDSTTPPTSECSHPNRPTITFDSFDPASDKVEFDLAALFADSDLSTDTAGTPPGCHSAPPDVNECTPIFPTLGLDYTTGMCTNNCADQTAFKVMQ